LNAPRKTPKRLTKGASDEWRTPLSFVAEVTRELPYRFVHDLACTEDNCIVRRSVRAIAEQNGERLAGRAVVPSRWFDHREEIELRPIVDTLLHPPTDKLPSNHARWCNPPYSRIPEFVRMCHAAAEHSSVFMLIPAYTDTAIWHDVIFPLARGLWFPRGRFKFEIPGRRSSCARFPSALVWFGWATPGRYVEPGRALCWPRLDENVQKFS
jgi:hypothetical protein